MRQRILPFLFLAYGLYSMYSLQSNFQTVERLTVYFVLLVPAFLLFNIAFRWYEAREKRRPLDTALHWVSRSMNQNFTQYVLMFCLPFFIAGQHWFYAAIHIFALAVSLWEPWWSRLLASWIFRRAMLLWSLLSGSSFLFPFLWPDRLSWFYPALTLVGLTAFIPGRRDKSHLITVGWGSLGLVAMMLTLPLAWRFPVLSIWLQKPHFETDTADKDETHRNLGAHISAADLRGLLADGHSVCCVAPIVAPPRLREKVVQEWTIDGHVIESPELKTSIAGNAEQRAFRSYYCKQNFPALETGQVLRCRLFLQHSMTLGGAQLDLF